MSTVSEAVGLGPEVADQVKQPEAMEVRLLEDSTASATAEQGLSAEEAGLMEARSGPAAEKLEVGVNRSWAMGGLWPRGVQWSG